MHMFDIIDYKYCFLTVPCYTDVFYFNNSYFCFALAIRRN